MGSPLQLKWLRQIISLSQGQWQTDYLLINHLFREATQKKNRDFLGIFPKGGGGSSQFPKLLQINQVIFGMPKSFLGAKTCFTIVGR